MIRLAIFLDHAILRWALRRLAEETEDFAVTAASTGSEMLETLRRERSDVVLVDSTESLKELTKLETPPAAIALAWHGEPVTARAIVAGAHGVFDANVQPEEIVRAIRAVARGEQIVPPNLEEILQHADAAARALTHREHQVMEMIARGMANREIAEHLEISVKTVDTHRGHVLKKLGLRNNSELTRFAVKHGYVAL
jgi:two-component system invasion response regulator UvrY